MSASEVKEDSIQFVKEYVETIITKALNELHESEREPESTAPPLPKVDSNEPCKPIADHNKLKTENSVEETTSNTESNSTEFEQPKADTSTETADVGKESAKDFPEEDPPAEIGVTTKFLPALTADGFETDKLKKTTGQSKEKPENYNLNKPGQHGACNPTEENQREVNKTPEKTESPKQVEDLDEASEKNVNRSLDQQTKSSTKPGPLKRTQSTEKLFVQTQQEEPGKNSNLENQTISEPTPESTVTNRLQQKLSFSRKDFASQTSIETSKAVTTEFQISIYHIVLIIMSSTIA